MILIAGLVVNVAINLWLIPRYGIDGAAVASSVSYLLTALLTLIVFHRLSGRGWIETLVIRRSDLVALLGALRAGVARLRGRRTGPLIGMRGGPDTEAQIIDEHDPGEEL